MKNNVIRVKTIIKVVICVIMALFLISPRIYAYYVGWDNESEFLENFGLIKLYLSLTIVFQLVSIILNIIKKGKYLYRFRWVNVLFNIIFIICLVLIGIKYNIVFNSVKYYIPAGIYVFSSIIQLCAIAGKTQKRRNIMIYFTIIGIISVCVLFIIGIIDYNVLNETHSGHYYTIP